MAYFLSKLAAILFQTVKNFVKIFIRNFENFYRKLPMLHQKYLIIYIRIKMAYLHKMQLYLPR